MNLFEDLLDLVEIEEIIKGYTHLAKERKYLCLICGQSRDEDVIYQSHESKDFINARRAMEDHIEEEHGGVFNYLINLESSLTGLTSRQKEIFEILYKYRDNQEISELMNTTPATVRSYRYKNRERAKQSKLFLAISHLLEMSDAEEEDSESLILNKAKEYRKKLETTSNEGTSIENILGKKNLDYIEGDKYD